MKEFQVARGAIVDNVMSKSIGEFQAIEQLKGMLLVLGVKEYYCSPSVRQRVAKEKSLIISAIDAIQQWQNDKNDATKF